MDPSALSKVLGTPELLGKILSNLPLLDLHQCQLVNKRWDAIIREVPELLEVDRILQFQEQISTFFDKSPKFITRWVFNVYHRRMDENGEWTADCKGQCNCSSCSGFPKIALASTKGSHAPPETPSPEDMKENMRLYIATNGYRINYPNASWRRFRVSQAVDPWVAVVSQSVHVLVKLDVGEIVSLGKLESIANEVAMGSTAAECSWEAEPNTDTVFTRQWDHMTSSSVGNTYVDASLHDKDTTARELC